MFDSVKRAEEVVANGAEKHPRNVFGRLLLSPPVRSLPTKTAFQPAYEETG